jgi:hypothetical protein
MALKDPRILYFLAGSEPTPRDTLAAMELGSNVVFRNGSVPNTSNSLEKCEGVSGPAIPEAYAAKPDGAEVIAAHRDRIRVEAMEGVAKLDAAEKAAQEAAQAPTKATAPTKPAKPAAAPVGNPGAAAGWTAGQ